MIYFYEELVKLARDLLDEKSMQDDFKASNDLNDITNALNNACPTKEFIDYAKQLDRRINEDYSEICEIHKVASKMTSTIGVNQESFQSEYDAILKDLHSDKFGIYASVLLKHGKISCIKDFIKRVD